MLLVVVVLVLVVLTVTVLSIHSIDTMLSMQTASSQFFRIKIVSEYYMISNVYIY